MIGEFSMGMTVSQVKAIWLAQQRSNSIRYRFMTQADQDAFNAENEVVFGEMENYLMQRYGNTVGDYGASEDFVDIGTDPVYPPAGTTTIGGITTVTQLEKHVVKVNSSYYNLNLLDIKDPLDITKNDLEEVWVFAYDPHSPEIPSFTSTVPSVPTVVKNDVIFKRFVHDENTWNPGEPDMFARNVYFKVIDEINNTITWVERYDPTQSQLWTNIVKQNGDTLSGTLSVTNKLSLDQGLNEGIYDPMHPEDIDPGWNLISSGGGMFIWGFSYSDDTYRLQITQQTNGSYLHAVLFKQMAIEEWYNKYVGDQY